MDSAAKRLYEAENRDNYGKTVKYGDGISIDCYSKKQMKSIFPKGNFHVVGEYAHVSNSNGEKDSEDHAVLRHMDRELALKEKGKRSGVLYWRSGYVACKGLPNSFVALLKNRVALLLLALILAVGLITGGVMICVSLASGTPAGPGGLELDKDAVDWEGTLPPSEGGNSGGEDGIRSPGYKSMAIEANSREVSVNLVNPEGNQCYFVISIALNGTDEVIYESKLIPPGKGLYKITLTKPLAPGTYDAQLRYEAYDLASQSRLNGAVVNFALNAVAE